MALKAATLILLSVLHVCSSTSVRPPDPHRPDPARPDPARPGPARRSVGWFQRCLSSSANLSLTALEVLPGGGWDNLRNLDMGRVMDFSYAQCQTTEDGFYFVPDDVFAVPRKLTTVETYAEVFGSWQDHKSSTARSMNVGGSATGEEGELHGKFSTEHQRVKTNQINDHSVTTRVQVRNRIYTVMANPDFRLDPHFVQQIENIADSITDNQTRLATYLSEKLVADYGTHVIISVDAGAALVKEDYVKSSSLSSSDSSMTSTKAAAGYSFFGLFSIDIDVGYSQDSSDQSAYASSVTSSFMEGHGGLPYYPGMWLSKWQESTRNNLVAIDRSGLPLHYVINTNTLPDLPEPIVSQVAASLQQAIEHYYKVNTHPGCVDQNSENFHFQANVDDGSCDGASAKHSLGGVFLTCAGDEQLCQKLVQTNPDTGGYSCKSPYQQTLLNTEDREEPYYVRVCTTNEYACGFLSLSTCSEENCASVVKVRSANVYTYWCYSSSPTENTGFLFGGVYGKSVKNPITKRRSCPPNFTPIKFLSNDFMICLSQEYELGAAHAVSFGGFFSCSSTNPLTGHSDCPPGFRQHLVTFTDDGCSMYYCVKSGLFRVQQLLSVRLPPFTSPPVMGPQSNGNRIRVLTEGKQSWVKVGQSRSWKRAATDNVQDAIKRSVAESADVSGQKAGVGLGVTAVVILMIVGVVLTVRWKKGLPLCKKHRRGGGGGGGAETQDVHEMEQA